MSILGPLLEASIRDDDEMVTPHMRQPFRQLAMILLAVLLMGICGCVTKRDQQTLAERCTRQGGVMVDGQCQPRDGSKSEAWSEGIMKEMERGFEERQPGMGRF